MAANEGPNASDRDLLLAWRDGDQRAAERLFERHASSIAYFFRNKLSTGAEDLVQQTFLGLVEGRHNVAQATNVRAYLFGIANNLLRKHLRSRARAPRFDPGVSSVAQIDPGPSTLLGQKHEQRLLLEGLRRIPVDHQVALELYYWEVITPVIPNPATRRDFGKQLRDYTGLAFGFQCSPVLPSAPADAPALATLATPPEAASQRLTSALGAVSTAGPDPRGTGPADEPTSALDSPRRVSLGAGPLPQQTGPSWGTLVGGDPRVRATGGGNGSRGSARRSRRHRAQDLADRRRNGDGNAGLHAEPRHRAAGGEPNHGTGPARGESTSALGVVWALPCGRPLACVCRFTHRRPPGGRSLGSRRQLSARLALG